MVKLYKILHTCSLQIPLKNTSYDKIKTKMIKLTANQYKVKKGIKLCIGPGYAFCGKSFEKSCYIVAMLLIQIYNH